MRLRLIAVLAGVLVAPPSGAGGRVATHVDSYADGAIQVIAPSVQATWEGEDTTVEGRYTADAWSGATPVLAPDAATGATEVAETRHAGGITVTHRPAVDRSATASMDLSLEPDFAAVAAALGGTVDLLDRMATLAATGRVTVETLGSVDDPALAERSLTGAVDLGWSHVLGPTTVGRVLATAAASWCGERYGCAASPYRFVPVHKGGLPLGGVHERLPDRRGRVAVAGRLSQALGGVTAVHAGYRLYADTWGITGHTVDASVAWSGLQERLELALRTRGALQGAAPFHTPELAVGADPTLPAWRSADREIGGVDSLRLGGRARGELLSAGPLLGLGATVRVDRHWYRYPSFHDRAAWVIGGGVDASW